MELEEAPEKAKRRRMATPPTQAVDADMKKERRSLRKDKCLIVVWYNNKFSKLSPYFSNFSDLFFSPSGGS